MAICESVPDIFFTQEPVTTNGAQENMPVTGFPLRPPHRCKPGEGYGHVHLTLVSGGRASGIAQGNLHLPDNITEIGHGRGSLLP